jgi:hypothetical protein
MRRQVTACFALAAALTGGCTSGPPCHEGRLIAEHHPGGPATTTAAPYRADYALYQEQGDGRPFLWRGLARQESVGFERNADGALLAVAGPDHIPLTEGCYTWHITPQSEPNVGRKLALLLNDTSETVVYGVVVAGLVGAGVGLLVLYAMAAGHSG